jgi:hypothetical protein
LFGVGALGGVRPPPPPPPWYVDNTTDYPASHFISAVGEGAAQTDAETAAVAAVSLFFKTATDVRNEALREFNEVVAGKSSEFFKKTRISEAVTITSQADFLGIRFTAPWFNQSRNQWAVLAYINKREASEIYRARIEVNRAIFDSLILAANAEDEPLLKYRYLGNAVPFGAVISEDANTLAVVDPAAALQYGDTLRLTQETAAAYISMRSGLSFNVRLSGDRLNRIQRKLLSLLERNGYTASPSGAMYTITGDIESAEEDLPAGIFIRSGINLRVINARGISLFSYNANYTRVGHKILDQAYNRAFLQIENDMENSFIQKFNAGIGG